ncbi:DNA repair protein RecO [Erysipelothrix sp. P66]|uniref:DNA repair protein RecO n=1 Tax=Erysipelothrix sp. P66 TaxID=3141531 RepID=UPI00315DF8F2
MNNKDIGFIVSIVPFREHDAMVHFLGYEYGLIRMVLPGYYRAKSKQGRLGLEFSKVQYRFNYQNQKLNRIIGGESINAYLQVRQDLDWLMYMSLVSELTVRCYDANTHASFYNWFENCIESTDLKVLCIKYLAFLIQLQGFTPDVEGCVVCGNTHVNAFSIEQGGYVCATHAYHQFKTTKSLMIALLGIFSDRDVDAYLETINQYELLKILVEYLEFHGDYKFNSWKLISDV